MYGAEERPGCAGVDRSLVVERTTTPPAPGPAGDGIHRIRRRRGSAGTPRGLAAAAPSRGYWCREALEALLVLPRQPDQEGAVVPPREVGVDPLERVRPHVRRAEGQDQEFIETATKLFDVARGRDGLLGGVLVADAVGPVLPLALERPVGVGVVDVG